MASPNKFNCFSGNLAEGVHKFSTAALKIMLTNTLPVATNAVYADVSGAELANGNGYTTGGVALATQSDTDTSGTVKLIESSDNTITCVTAPLGPFRYAILYDTTPSSPLKPLIEWWDYGSSVTLNVSETFLLDSDQTAGLWQLV